ncbi:Aminotransferase class-III [Aliiroseovarius crassostreae]|nr:aminotransferase class III-fold pyridoxal phosphate-dependent enzyme [Aliiroseovarius crassostreae]SFU74211.1 Aminotransferase class-III [Aliiroseovarius crassostreae]
MLDQKKSQAATQRLSKVLAGGIGSGGRIDHRGLFLTEGTGARVTDADGRSYIDYMMGFGALILGHRPAPVVDAVQTALGNPIRPITAAWTAVQTICTRCGACVTGMGSC